MPKGFIRPDDIYQIRQPLQCAISPDGRRLAVKFTDIDMAGDFQPGRPQLSDVRIMKAVYPPRLKFSYTVTDASGQIVSQGDENLVDTIYLSRMRGASASDSLFFEKAMLADWMASKLRK